MTKVSISFRPDTGFTLDNGESVPLPEWYERQRKIYRKFKALAARQRKKKHQDYWLRRANGRGDRLQRGVLTAIVDELLRRFEIIEIGDVGELRDDLQLVLEHAYRRRSGQAA